jgi:hypothetical protein
LTIKRDTRTVIDQQGTERRMPAMLAAFITPPEKLEGFPDAVKVHSKGKGKRRPRRWEDAAYIYEWDGLHGRVEKYDKRGHHVGEFDPRTGVRVADAVAGRRTEV